MSKMRNPHRLRDCGGKRLIAIYPHRDADYSRITLQTKNLMLVSCGVPGISFCQLKEAVDEASGFVLKFCGGTVGGAEY